MYGSFRFYIDKRPDSIGAPIILEILDMISRELDAPYSRIIHVLYSPDEDRPKVYLEYENDENGRRLFETNHFIQVFTGKHGDVSSPLVRATCCCDPDKIYSGISIEVQLPCGSNPMILRVDFDCRYIQAPINLHTYSLLLFNLYNKGFIVNNAFLHVYRKKNTATTLDGGQIGTVVSLDERRNIKQAIAHRQKGNVGCALDVFYINSFHDSLIGEAERAEIARIVGNSFVTNVAENLVFSLPITDLRTNNYRKACGKVIRQLRKFLFYAHLMP